MTTYHRAITHQGETVVVTVSDEGVQSVKHLYMYVDNDPLDLHPAQYTNTRLVELGDLVCCGGDEFRVVYMRPGMDGYPFGQIRGESGAWYNTEYAVLLERRQ